MKEISIFIDDGGVMNDNNHRGEQWQNLIAEYFIPRYGGEPEAWREANMRVMEIIIQKVEEMINEKPNLEYKQYQTFEDEIWLNYIFEFVNLEPGSKYLYKPRSSYISWSTQGS